MKTLYFECFSGISGDMTIGALLDLGASKENLLKAIDSLNIDGYKINIGTVQKCGITSTKFDVILDSEEIEHSHDNHEHSHDEHEHSHDNHEHSHDEHKHSHDEHEHGHDEHEHNHDNHEHHHRGLKEIRDIINNSGISQKAKQMSLDVFEVLAKAEGKVHGVAKEEVHFHEVGAVDSIIDIIGIAVCIDELKVDSFVASKIYEGQGHVWCQHGMVPVPAPATLELCVANSIPLHVTATNGEMITPTGAALIASLKPTFGPLPDGKISGVGIGAGTKDFKHANILRVYMIETQEVSISKDYIDKVIFLETNIDDSKGEHLGYAIEKLLEAGALDVYYTPIYMKKNRPAYSLSVLCEADKEADIIKQIFEHTTAIGIRKQEIERVKMERKFETIGTVYGDVVVKHCKYEDVIKTYFEYESLKKCASNNNIGLYEVEKTVNIVLK
ncbi:MAG: nickel pincer cofactor biosynthesis protein LarC [Proteocatella sp.]